jgi:hypothetical protein
MATTFVDYTGDGNATKSFSFPSIKEADIKVEVDEVLKTLGNHYNITSYTTTGGGNVVFTSGNIPASPAAIRIFRDTDVDSAKATYTAGSSVKANDLNNNQTQVLYAAQEEQNQTIQTHKIKDSAVTTAKIKADNITSALIADDQINSEHYVDGSIDTAHIADANITTAKLADNAVTTAKITDAQITTAKLAADAVTTAKITDNSVTTNKIAADAITAAKIGDDVINSEHYAAGSIDTEHIADLNVTTGKIAADAITNAKIADDSIDSEHYADGSIDTAHIADAQITTAKLADDAVTDAKIADGTLDNRYYTETELDAGQLDNRYFTETESDARYFRQDSTETISSGNTWSSSDSFIATTGAINARIVDLIDDVGGFTAITSEQHFPNTNPQGSTGQAAILSIQAASTTLTPSGTTVTISNGNLADNANITITGVSAAIPSGFGFLVESTSTLHTYTFHRLVPKATEVTTVATNATAIATAATNVADINNFADLYIISSSEPTQRADGTSLQEGDLWYDSSNDNLQVYTGSAFSIITPSQSVLDDVAIVSGAITYSEDLGLITDAASTGSSNGSLDIVADALEDEVTFTVTAATGKFIIDGEDKPALTLYKGWTYTFDLSDASNASHPLRFSSGGSAYSTGVTVTGTQGQAGAKIQLVVPESQPTSFIYYCTNHSGMGNSITVKDDPIKTVSDNITNINTVASDLTEDTSEIDTVATNITNVNNVGNNISNVNSVHNNATNINSAVSNATNINTVAGSISNVNTVASNVSGINDFADRYRVASSAPSSNNDAGDLYFDTTSNELRVYNGSSWQGGVTATGNLAGLGANTFTGNQTINANIIVSGTVDGKDVSTLIANVVEDTSPQLGGALDGQNNNMSNIGTIDGTNLQLDFGTL